MAYFEKHIDSVKVLISFRWTSAVGFKGVTFSKKNC